MTRIAVLAPLPPELLRSRFPDAEIVTVDDQAEALAAARGAIVCIADWRGQVVVDADVVAALAPTCLLVQVPAAGLTGVDLDACAALGIPVSSCAGLNAAAVAEWCLWAAIDGLRRLTWSDRALRDGRWEMFGHARFELAGKIVGLLGLGAVGTATAERLRPFGADVRYWSRRRRDPDEEQRLQVRWSELDPLLAEVDVLIVTVALTPETRYLLDRDRIGQLKPTTVVVNAARGEVVDEQALGEALAQGRLLGVVTDVYAQEPPPAAHPLVTADFAVTTPHVAGVTVESAGRIVQRVLTNVDAVLRGETPEGLIA